MRFFKRVANIIRSNLNEMLDKAEDPQKMLDQSIDDMQKAIKEGTKAVAEAQVALKKLEKEREANQKAIELWEQRAMRAMEAGDEETAKEALRKKKALEELAKTYDEGVERQRQQNVMLQQSLEALKTKIERAKVMKRSYLAQYRRAEAKQRIADMMKTGAVDKSAFAQFEQLADKIEEAELETEAIADFEPKQWEVEVESATRDAELEAELAKLKEKIHAAPKPEKPKEPPKPKEEPKKEAEEEPEMRLPPIEP